MWRSSLRSISWLRHQIFYPYVTISATQTRESDDLHHAMSPFSLFLPKNLGICEATKDRSSASSKNGKEGASGGASDWDNLRLALWHYWLSNAPLKDAEPELRQSKYLKGTINTYCVDLHILFLSISSYRAHFIKMKCVVCVFCWAAWFVLGQVSES